MLEFLRDLFSRPGAPRTVILLEPDTMNAPRQYEVRPTNSLYAIVIGVVLASIALVVLILLTPLRGLVYGPAPEQLRDVAESNAIRAEALEDSLVVQQEQIALLRAIITGEGDVSIEPVGEADMPFSGSLAADSLGPEPPPPAREILPRTRPALPLRSLQTRVEGADAARAEAYLSGLRLPSLPPVSGVLSRGYDANRGHLAIDIAADEGTPVRSIGDGYVTFADWTQAGGYTIAVQHADGYLSIYKHNARLLKRAGERVRSREVVALSGNTGEITSGPHLHFELWRDGLAQDPASFLILS
ncbi:MAG: M23 family metallopeptidase [Bacteroidota bacterium]